MVRTVEGYAGEHKTNDHTRSGENHNLASADDIDVFECEKREDEIRARDDETDSCWIIEPDLLEDGRAVVHESVEAAKLLEGLHAACDN